MTMESRKEKVLEIAKQAGFVVDIGGHHDRNADLHYSLDRFAELFVRECANRATWAQDTGVKDIGGEVLKHFGVEE